MKTGENKTEKKPAAGQGKTQNEKPRSSAFRESHRGDEKSTSNIEEEAELEQERKQATTERD